MKLSRSEDCEINQGSDECPQLLNEESAAEGMNAVSLTDVRVQSEEIITIEANERNILRVDHIELERKERNHQILQNFGKALWKVLKQYKRKLEVAENEICTLRNCLTSEKTRSAELENQLRDWQSNCCCREGISSEVFSRVVDEFRGKNSLDCEEHQSTDCNETDQQLESSIGDAIGAEDLKNTNEIKAETTHWNGKATAVLSGSCSLIDQEYKRKEESFVSTSQVTFVDRDKNDLLKENHAVFDSVIPECRVSPSRSSLSFENNSSFPVGENQTQNKEDKTAQQLKRSIGDATGVEDLKNPNETIAEGANWNGKAATLLSGSCSCINQEYEQENGSSVSTSQATSTNKDNNDLLEEDHMLSDSVFPECTISSSKSSLCVESNSSFPVGEDQTQNGELKRLLGPSTTLMPGEGEHAVGHCDNSVLEADIKHDSGSKFQNADKPKRRLLPVSSILLKDIGSINFKDENEKPKGVKAEKKRASGENRTQGSISLLRLLKDNLVV